MVTQGWGFLRETREVAKKSGLDPNTGLHRTGLEEYLDVIFPETNDWVHDKPTGLIWPDGKLSRTRPDYRSESLKLIVEFDGLPHYTKPSSWADDLRSQELYESSGYRVVRIPYFIQLTNQVVLDFFGVRVSEILFDPSLPSISEGPSAPAFLCPLGVRRMAWEYKRSTQQYIVNLRSLKKSSRSDLSGWEFLQREYDELD